MSKSRVSKVRVDELRQKLRLIRTYTPHETWAGLAGRFGVPVGTLKYWAHGSASRDPDQMPGWAVQTVLDLFAAILPAGRSADDMRRLVLGPAAQLEEEIRSGSSVSLTALIRREAKSGTARLIRKPAEGALVEIEGEASGDHAMSLRLGERFRIEFPLDRHGTYAVALQHAQRTWSVIPSAIAATSRRLRVPGLPGDTDPRFMRERRDAGLHQFVCLQANAPFPAIVDEHRREGTSLDKRALDAVATL